MSRLRDHLGLTHPAELVRMLPAAGVLAVWIALMPQDGGFNAADRLPAGLVLAGLLAVAAVGGRRVLPAAGPARWALLAFTAFTAFNFLSIAWSDAPGSAWEASNLLLVTLLGAWTLALAPWRSGSAGVLLALFSVAAAMVCLGSLIAALGAGDLTSRFDDFRWQPPLGYPNTTAAFGFIAAIGMVVMAARPDLPVVLKGLAQALATFLAAFALLPQSRGAVLGGTAALLVLIAFVPWRWRLVVHVGLLAATLILASGPILDVYHQAATTGRASVALGDATRTIGLATAAALVAGLLVALAEARIRLDERGRRTARLAGVGAVLVAVVGVGAVGVAHSAGIRTALDDQWTALKHPGSRFADGRGRRDNGVARFGFIDPLERYDYWRVALDGFRASPVGGIGAGGFEHRYTSERRYPKVSKYPHNLVMKVLSDTGVVGVLLLAGVLAAVGLGLLRRRSELGGGDVAVAAAALGMTAYFFAHGLFDWLEAYPVLTGPVVGFLIVALVVRTQAPDRGAGEARSRRSRLAVAAAGVLLVLAAASLAAPWLGLRYRDRASAIWRTQPAFAYQDLDRAATIDPLSPAPLVLQGVIGLQRGDLGRAADGFTRALQREDAWLPHFGLALIAAQRGNRRAAGAELDAALARDRLDPVLPGVAQRIRGAERIDPPALVREVLVSPLFDVERLK